MGEPVVLSGIEAVCAEIMDYGDDPRGALHRYEAKINAPAVGTIAAALRQAEKALGEADELAEAGIDPGDRIADALSEIRSLVDFAPESSRG